VGYALRSEIAPRAEDGGAPTGPADIMSGAGGSMGGPPAGAQMPAEVSAAVQRYRQTLRADPTNVEANIGLGNLQFDIGRYEQAIAHYTTALERDPGNADVRVDRAIAYHSTNQNDKAKAELERAAREHPEHRNAWLNLGVVSSSMGDRATAIRAWEQYLKLEPNGEHSDAIRAELETLKKGS
jgi:cytochrome c-type biogenesis protein CcmH/NrfG